MFFCKFQVLVLYGNDDKILWSYALEDISSELKLPDKATTFEIIQLLFQSLRSLDCEVGKYFITL